MLISSADIITQWLDEQPVTYHPRVLDCGCVVFNVDSRRPPYSSKYFIETSSAECSPVHLILAYSNDKTAKDHESYNIHDPDIFEKLTKKLQL